MRFIGGILVGLGLLLGITYTVAQADHIETWGVTYFHDGEMVIWADFKTDGTGVCRGQGSVPSSRFGCNASTGDLSFNFHVFQNEDGTWAGWFQATWGTYDDDDTPTLVFHCLWNYYNWGDHYLEVQYKPGYREAFGDNNPGCSTH